MTNAALAAVEPASPCWPPDLAGECRRRVKALYRIRNTPGALEVALARCKLDPVVFISEWCWTQDPRPAAVGKMTTLPFVLFPRQVDFVRWVQGRLEAQDDGLCEKSRELGVTWLCVGIGVWLWLFMPGAAVGFGSRKEQLVDRKGDMDSIFEKIRFVVDTLPKEFLPRGYDDRKHSSHMKLINPETGASITGEAGDNIGRGGRKTIYFKDEAAYYERPMLIESALSQNTNVQIDVSSIANPGSPFHEKATNWPSEKKFIFDWREDPRKNQEWYDSQKEKRPDFVIAREIDRNWGAVVEGSVIPGEWVKAAIQFKMAASGAKIAGLDVADGGLDSHSLVIRHGHVVTNVSVWKTGGATEAARRAHVFCRKPGVEEIRYERVGVGAAASGVAVDLQTKIPRFRGVNPGSTHLPGWYKLPSGGDKGIKFADMFLNEKAKAWWLLRDRFERTFEHVNGTKTYPEEQLISLAPLVGQKDFRQLESELSQAQYTPTQSGKIKINKTPEGYKSPNAADALVISYMDYNKITGVWGR